MFVRFKTCFPKKNVGPNFFMPPCNAFKKKTKKIIKIT